MSNPIETIEGIGPAYAEKLGAAGIEKTDQLLDAGATRKGREALAEKTGISGTLILKWVNHADLMRISGIGGEYAELLEAAGVDSVPELKQRNAENLAAKMDEVNAEKKLTRQVPTAPTLEKWIEAAKGLDRAVEH